MYLGGSGNWQKKSSLLSAVWCLEVIVLLGSLISVYLLEDLSLDVLCLDREVSMMAERELYF